MDSVGNTPAEEEAPGRWDKLTETGGGWMNAGIIEIDLHGKNVLQAKAEVDAVLKRTDSSVYRLRIIHGSHGGTGIRS